MKLRKRERNVNMTVDNVRALEVSMDEVLDNGEEEDVVNITAPL